MEWLHAQKILLKVLHEHSYVWNIFCSFCPLQLWNGFSQRFCSPSATIIEILVRLMDCLVYDCWWFTAAFCLEASANLKTASVPEVYRYYEYACYLLFYCLLSSWNACKVMWIKPISCKISLALTSCSILFCTSSFDEVATYIIM